MNKIQLKMLEDEEILLGNDTTDNQSDDLELQTDIELPEEISFIDSDELNEIRSVLLDIPDDIQLLLLNDSAIVLGTELENKMMLYTLTDDSDDFVLMEMPFEFNSILDNPFIIKYTSEGPDERHDKVMDLLMNKLEEPSEDKDTEKEENTDEQD